MLCFSLLVTSTTEIYTLSLHDALPISPARVGLCRAARPAVRRLSCFHQIAPAEDEAVPRFVLRSEEHTSELQSRVDLVCRLLLEKKKLSARPMSPTRNKPDSATTTQET